MLLEKILQSIEKERVNGETQIEIDSITYDSSKVKENSLFICIEGFNTDGHNYIEDAIKNIISNKIKN